VQTLPRQSPTAPTPGTAVGRVSSFVRQRLLGRNETAAVLGAFSVAAYFELRDGTVFAISNADAVALPIAVVVQQRSAALDLATVTGPAVLSDNGLRCAGLQISLGGYRDSRLRKVGEPDPAAVAIAVGVLAPIAEHRGVPVQFLTVGDSGSRCGPGLAAPAARMAGQLVGRGPGLTPAGDDLICGMLAGAVLFGRDVTALDAAVCEAVAHRPGLTTSLSRQLIHAARAGHGVVDLQRLARAVRRTGSPGSNAERVVDACHRITGIGHSSGAALGLGLLSAALAAPLADRRGTTVIGAGI
jgi:uncharacterized protein DUF2877